VAAELARHSTTGWIFILNQAALSWGSKKQPSVALSSCEAEIMAASEAAKEAVYLARLAHEFGLRGDGPLDLHVDNKAAIDVSYNPEHHTRMKHVERRHFFVRECVENHTLRVPFVATTDNYADFFTKALAGPQFFKLRDAIMNIGSPAHSYPGSRLRGGVENRDGSRLSTEKGVAAAGGHAVRGG